MPNCPSALTFFTTSSRPDRTSSRSTSRAASFTRTLRLQAGAFWHRFLAGTSLARLLVEHGGQTRATSYAPRLPLFQRTSCAEVVTARALLISSVPPAHTLRTNAQLEDPGDVGSCQSPRPDARRFSP